MQLSLNLFGESSQPEDSVVEEWRAIEWAAGYEVSSFGRFRHHARGTIRGTLAHNGYIHIGLSVEGNQRWKLAHRVVAAAFLPVDENKPVVNHIDGDRANNRASNLEWSSRSHNAKEWRRIKKDVGKGAATAEDLGG